MKLKDCEFMKVPVGANKRFLVTMNRSPFAGFDTRPKAETYIKMQLSKRHQGKDTTASKATWAITVQSS